MTTLDDIFDFDLYNQMVDEGYIRHTYHPDRNTGLVIANYSEMAQYGRVWNEATLNCRGLIYRNTDRKVIARGFPKFFNLSEHAPEEIPVGEPVVSNKFDGSLGILYLDPATQEFKIATRGSFTSDQAHKGTEILERYAWSDEISNNDFVRITNLFNDPEITCLFEIIYPSNRIVCDYGDQERLVLLDVIDNATGNSRLDLFKGIPWPDKAHKASFNGGSLSALADLIPKGKEGFVLYWPENGFRVKVKSEEYVQLHRVVTGLSEKSVWEMLGEGKTASQIKENVPDELFDWVDETSRILMDKAHYILDEAQEAFDTVWARVTDDAATMPPEELDRTQRATFARHANAFPVQKPFLFKIYDRVDHDVLWSMAWKMVKPTGDTRVWNKTSENDDGNNDG